MLVAVADPAVILRREAIAIATQQTCEPDTAITDEMVATMTAALGTCAGRDTVCPSVTSPSFRPMWMGWAVMLPTATARANAHVLAAMCCTEMDEARDHVAGALRNNPTLPMAVQLRRALSAPEPLASREFGRWCDLARRFGVQAQRRQF